MPTPSYVPFAEAGYSSSTVGTTLPVNALANDNAIADELMLSGQLLGANDTVSYSGGKVSSIVSDYGLFQVRSDFTYVASGPAAGKVDYELHYWSNDNGATWALRTDSAHGVTNGKLTYSYDGSGNLIGSTWS